MLSIYTPNKYWRVTIFLVPHPLGVISLKDFGQYDRQNDFSLFYVTNDLIVRLYIWLLVTCSCGLSFYYVFQLLDLLGWYRAKKFKYGHSWIAKKRFTQRLLWRGYFLGKDEGWELPFPVSPLYTRHCVSSAHKPVQMDSGELGTVSTRIL